MSNHAMSHGIYRVVDFEFMGNYSLRVSFDDGVTTLVDLEPVLEGELYGPLRDPAMFKTAHFDPEVHTLVWAKGAGWLVSLPKGPDDRRSGDFLFRRSADF
jgi:hypothetical protein